MTIGYGSNVLFPENDPVKAATTGKEYEFTGWKGYVANMKVTKNLVFEPMFKTIFVIEAEELDDLVDDNGTIQLTDTETEQLGISKDIINAVSEKIANNPEVKDVEVKTQNGTIKLGSDVIEFLNERMNQDAELKELSIDVIKVDNASLDELYQDVVKDRPTFDVTISGIETFGGAKLTIGLKYDLKEGEDPAHIRVWHINEDGTIERFTCTYEDGYVYFETPHLSYYTVVYEAPAVVDSPDERGFPMMYIGIAAVVAIIAILAVVAVRRN